MKLYHGTNIDFSTIDLAKSNKYKDFWQGFYLTDIRSQAEELAAKKSRLFGGYPVIQEYAFDESILDNNELKVLKVWCTNNGMGWIHFQEQKQRF